MEWPHLIDNSLKAHHLYRRDRDYVVQPNGEVVIVDEFTGRLMIGRQWSDGLHQAVEAKEGVKIKEENQTLATITLQNFFKLYKKLCGHDRHGHDRGDRVLQDLRPRRDRHPDQPAAHPEELPGRDLPVRAREERARSSTRSRRSTRTGRPILVGHRPSIEKSEELSADT